MKKVIIILIILLAVFNINLSAKSTNTDVFLKEQSSLAGAESLEESLPPSTRNYFEKNEINAGEGDWAQKFSLGKIFGDLWASTKERVLLPFTSAGLIIAVILINGALNSAQNSGTNFMGNYAITAVSAIVICKPLMEVIGSSVEVLKSVSVFMTAFIPVFAVCVAANGQPATSVTMSGLLLGVTQVVQLIAGNFVIPLMCGYLSVNVASGVSPLLAQSNIAESIKKISFWVLSLTTTVFLGVLSIQTTISASGDTLSIKTAKFLIGSSVPVAGNVLSEALTTVTASLGVLKTSVAIYGVVACCTLFLPILVELIIWRLILNLVSVVADMLSAGSTGKLLKSVDSCLAVLCGILLLTAALFIISLTVVVSVGKKV